MIRVKILRLDFVPLHRATSFQKEVYQIQIFSTSSSRIIPSPMAISVSEHFSSSGFSRKINTVGRKLVKQKSMIRVSRPSLFSSLSLIREKKRGGYASGSTLSIILKPIPSIPPHLTDESLESEEKDYSQSKTFSKYGAQGPSKYGAGGSRAYKALGRKQKKK